MHGPVTEHPPNTHPNREGIYKRKTVSCVHQHPQYHRFTQDSTARRSYCTTTPVCPCDAANPGFTHAPGYGSWARQGCVCPGHCRRRSERSQRLWISRGPHRAAFNMHHEFVVVPMKALLFLFFLQRFRVDLERHNEEAQCLSSHTLFHPKTLFICLWKIFK